MKHLPNTMPLKEGTADLFLAPQVKTPVVGRSWGMRAVYNCSIVQDASEFTILSERSKAKLIWTAIKPDKDPYIKLETAESHNIYISTGFLDSVDGNVVGHLEMGVQKSWSDFYSDPSNDPIAAKGLELTDVYEYVLWQRRMCEDYAPVRSFDNTTEPIVKGMGQPFIKTSNGTYAFNETFYKIAKCVDSELENFKSLMKWTHGERSEPASMVSLAEPIGVRCQVASTLGIAKLNPSHSTFGSFEMSAVPLMDNFTETPTSRLGKTAMDTMRGRFRDIFASVNAPSPDQVQNTLQYRNFIKPKMLHESIMLALGTDAIQLMYDTEYKFERAWTHPNLTSSTPGKILTTGKVGPAAPAILLAIWAVSCTLLSFWYDFRPR